MTVVAVGLTFAAVLSHLAARRLFSRSYTVAHPEFAYTAVAGATAFLSGVLLVLAAACWVVVL